MLHDGWTTRRTQFRCSVKLTPNMASDMRSQAWLLAGKLRPIGQDTLIRTMFSKGAMSRVSDLRNSVDGHTLTGFHFRTGEQRGSFATQRSSRSTAASTLPRCSSRRPQACRQQQAFLGRPPGGPRPADSSEHPHQTDLLSLPCMSFSSALHAARSATQDAVGAAPQPCPFGGHHVVHKDWSAWRCLLFPAYAGIVPSLSAGQALNKWQACALHTWQSLALLGLSVRPCCRTDRQRCRWSPTLPCCARFSNCAQDTQAWTRSGHICTHSWKASLAAMYSCGR